MTTTPRAVINLDLPGPTVSRHIYGHFAEHLGRCVYGGLYVGEDSPIPNIHGLRTDVIEALRAIDIPNLRWPGGCFADEYHWRDGIGPRDERPTMVNTNWGDVVEDNSFGTHEFMELCELLGAEPYITGNVGSGTVQEMSEWVDYLTRDGDSPMARLRRENGRDEPWRVPFFGVGNENWGCGGNMRPETYAAEARRYATFVRNHDGNRITRIACGPNADDYRWTEVMMQDLLQCDTCPKAEPGPYQAISLHSYTFTGDDFSRKGDAADFTVDDWYTAFKAVWRMDELITRHSTIMDKYDPFRRVGLVVDEWGAWWDATEGTNPAFLSQRNIMRDALIASVHLDIFHRHAERVIMANLAQTVNVLQSPILTDEATGAMVLTPTYWVFHMNKGHHDATRLDLRWVDDLPVRSGDGRPVHLVSASASRKDDTVLISLTTIDAEAAHTLRIDLRGEQIREVHGLVLTSGSLNTENTVDNPDAVAPAPFDDFTLAAGVLKITLPRGSFVTLTLTIKD